MAQPPGSETSASPNRDRSGPKTKIEALIVLTRSYGAVKVFISFAFNIKRIFSSKIISTPILWSKVSIVEISFN